MLSPSLFKLLRSAVLAVIVFLGAIALFKLNYQSLRWRHLRSPDSVDYSASNATLGFEAILVTAPKNVPARLEWRTNGLLKAAARTGLRVEVPAQPDYSEEDIREIARPDGKNNEANALAFLGHRNSLKVATKYATALILEDDVDWDVEIRSAIGDIASAIREISGYQPPNNNGSALPYGDAWDVLWLGHCGDSIRTDHPAKSFVDPTVPPFFKSWEKNLAPDPRHTRWVHFSSGPVCSFAFAVTGAAAERLLRTPNDGKENFDIFLHILCKGGKLRCITVNPELFHHHEMPGQKDSLINGQTDDDFINEEMTANIWHSARCNSDTYDKPLRTCMGPEPDKR